jgi:hypothetical protein
MKYWEIVADKLSAVGWSWGIAVLLEDVHTSLGPIIDNYGSSALDTRYVS